MAAGRSGDSTGQSKQQRCFYFYKNKNDLLPPPGAPTRASIRIPPSSPGSLTSYRLSFLLSFLRVHDSADGRVLESHKRGAPACQVAPPNRGMLKCGWTDAVRAAADNAPMGPRPPYIVIIAILVRRRVSMVRQNMAISRIVAEVDTDRMPTPRHPCTRSMRDCVWFETARACRGARAAVAARNVAMPGGGGGGPWPKNSSQACSGAATRCIIIGFSFTQQLFVQYTTGARHGFTTFSKTIIH
jgi:hypothetical protein